MIPLATTTVTILRPPELEADDDPYDESVVEPAEVASGVRANIAVADGREELSGRSARESVAFRLRCDPVDITNSDVVVDDVTGERYGVVWCRQRVTGLGLDHVVADLEQIGDTRDAEGGS